MKAVALAVFLGAGVTFPLLPAEQRKQVRHYGIRKSSGNGNEQVKHKGHPLVE
jgi:hypothetical protein